MGPPQPSTTRLVLLPYLQTWDGTNLNFNLLLIPRGGSPLDPLDPAASTTDPSFTNAIFKLDVHILPGDDLPVPGGTPFTSFPSPAPANAQSLFKTLTEQLPIDPAPQPAARKPANTQVRKHLPLSYQIAVGFTPGGENPLVSTDNTYKCALTHNDWPPTYTKLPTPGPLIPWGKVIASLLRNPVLGAAAGLIRQFSVAIDPASKPENADLVKKGGFLYVTLASDSDGAGLISAPGGDALKIYASHFPRLEASSARPVFTPVLFPVVDPAPTLDYADIFAEIEDYDDGWAKTVHCGQQQQLNPLVEKPDGTRPMKEMGIRLGWDDEQITTWINRQLDASQPEYDAPLGVSGYRVDVRLADTTGGGTTPLNWNSLVRAVGDITVGGIHFPPNPVELSVAVHPVNHDAASAGTFWLPMYYTQWSGPALVMEDELRHKLAGIPDSPPGTMKGIMPDTALTYGKTYEFQVRLMDSTGGGPDAQIPHITPGVQPVGRIDFKRYIIPHPVQIVDDDLLPQDPDAANPPASVKITRPLLQYPAVACTGYYANVGDLLLADLDLAKTENREAGLPDPDVDRVSIVVEADCFAQDPAATDGSFMPIYTTTRPFPADASEAMQLEFAWVDIADVETMRGGEESKTTGPLTLPTARTLRLRLSPLCRADDQLHYFGGDDVRTSGQSVYVTLRKNSKDERKVFADDIPSHVFGAYFLQPDKPSDQVMSSVDAAPPDIAARLADALDLRLTGLTMRAQPGQRVIFGCAAGLRHTIGPDGASLSFASRTDLGLRWLAVIRLRVNRDWTWDGFDYNAISVERDGQSVGKIIWPRSISTDAFIDDPDAMKLARSQTDVVFIDSINPLPPPGELPQLLNPEYTITPVFQASPVFDPPRQLTIRLPVTTAPTQVPQLASAGIALSPYVRAGDYSSTNPRTKTVWLEFTEPLRDSRDAYFARVIRDVPDPLISFFGDVGEQLPTPGLAINAESVRHVIQDQAADAAGLGAMTQLIPSETSPLHFALPLPADEDSPTLFGFWEYEFRVGHSKSLWCTAQSRFGPGLIVNGIQHPPPQLQCRATHDPINGITCSAPHAVSVFNGTLKVGPQPRTQMWFMLYVQAAQLDGADSRNILLNRARGAVIRNKPVDRTGNKYVDAWAKAVFDEKSVQTSLTSLGFEGTAGLSVLAVEVMPMMETSMMDPMGGDLGRQRILRTSALVPVPASC